MADYSGSLGMFQMSGLASGMDINSIISKLMEIEQRPLDRKQEKFNELKYKQMAWKEVDSKLEEYHDYLATFRLQSNLIPKSASSTNESILTATAPTTASNTTFYTKVINLATGTKIEGGYSINQKDASGTDKIDPAVTQFQDLSYNATPTAGDYTIKVKRASGTWQDVQITVNDTDTINDILGKINTDADLNATYDTTTGKVTIDLSGGTATEITLGSSSDTANLDEVFNFTDSTFNTTTKTLVSSKPIWYPSSTKSLSDLGLSTDYYSLEINNSGINISKDDSIQGIVNKINKLSQTSKTDAYGLTQFSELTNDVTPTSGTYTIKALDSSSATLDTVTLNINDSSTIDDILSQINASSYLSAKFSNGKLEISAESSTNTVSLGDSGDTSNFDEVFNLDDAVWDSDNKKYDSSTSVLVPSTDVRAWIDESTGKLNIQNTNGGPKSLEVSGDDDLLDILGLNGTNTQTTGKAAEVEISVNSDGSDAMTLTSEDNSIEYNGVTLNLVSQSADTGTASDFTQISVSQDVDSSIEKIKEFIDKHNEIMEFLYDKLHEKKITDKDEKDMTDEDKMTGMLKGDNTLEDIFYKIRDNVYQSLSWSGSGSTYTNFKDIGITSGDSGSSYENTTKGLLDLTFENDLKSALQSNPTDVWKLFGLNDTTNEDYGYVTSLKSYLWETTKYNGTIDTVSGTNGTIGKEMHYLAIDMADMIEVLEHKQLYYTQKFSAMEAAINKMNMQAGYMMQQTAK